MGRITTYLVSVPNGDTTYTVSSRLDRLAGTLDFQQGIQVEVRAQQVTDLRCREPGLIENLEGVDLRQAN